MSVLGYPTSAAQMRQRLEAITSDDDYITLVASDGEQIIGFVGTRVGPVYESDRPCARLDGEQGPARRPAGTACQTRVKASGIAAENRTAPK